jgi:hypothetical protein
MSSQQAQSFTEALSNYLSGDEWQQSIDIFVRTNCAEFLDVSAEDYGHQHHTLWKTFQDIVENVLEMALNMVGGSVESLEKVLDEVASTPSRGPKEDVVKDILSKLLTFDSFNAFAEMMYNAALENGGATSGGNHRNPYHHERPTPGSASTAAPSVSGHMSEIHYSGTGSDHRDTLVGMGFDKDMIDMVLEGTGEDCQLEQLVMVLSDMQAQNDAEEKKNKARGKFSDRVHEAKNDDQSTPIAPRNMPTSPGSDQTSSALRLFATEAGVQEWNELNARFVTARSILDTFIDGDTSDGVVEMVQWASDMVELYQSIQESFESGCGMSDPTKDRPDGLVAWYLELEEIRKECASGSNTIMGDQDIIRMAELDRIAEMGTSDEKLLHSTITRHDEVQRDINLLHRRCGAMSGPGTNVKRETIEELYLYLKEKISNASDLASVADEMHEHVYSMVDSAHGGDIINILLEMHVLEDEQSILRQKIDSMLGSPTHAAESKTSPPGLFGEDAAAAGSKDGPSDGAKMESGGFELHEAKATPNDPFIRERSAAIKTQSRDEDIDEDALKAHVSNMKHGHKKSLETLKQSLDGEKDRALSALEERLLRRRRQREKELANARENGATPEEITALDKELRAAEAELETEIASTTEQHNKLKEGVCNGFKKRCIAEIKATQVRGQALNAEETDEAHRDAAEALKNRFFRDHKNLQELLEAERAKARRKIMFNLEKRKRDSNGDATATKRMEQDARDELGDMEIDFEQQELAALAGPQSNILLALSGIFADKDIFSNTGKVKGDGDDDDDFFDDDNNVNEGVKAWADRIGNLRDTYMNAGFALQAKMRSAFENDNEDEAFDASFGAIAQHMTQVITNAYTSQLSDTEAMTALKKKSELNQSADADLVKASILEEFEKSRSTYEQTLENARADAKRKLEKRNAKKGGGHQSEIVSRFSENEEKDWGSESIRIKKTQAALEQAVDNFLDDPIIIGAGGMRNNASIQSYNAKFDATKTSRHAQRKAEKEVRAKEEADAKDSSSTTNVASHVQEQAEFTKFKEEQALQLQKDNIKTKSQSREKELIDALHVEMLKKKHRLEERLRRKKAKRESDQDDFGLESEAIEEQQAQQELANMEAAFEKAVNLLKRTDQARLKGVNVSQLIDVMDRFAKKATDSDDVPSPAPKVSDDETVEDIESKMEDNLSWDLPPPSHTHQAIEARKTMETEVARISETYNEEKQKLDLMMKIQQARQKQSLQRKLMDRKQGQGIGQGMTATRSMGNMRSGAGFSSDGPMMATGGLGRQLPPIKTSENAVRGLGAAGTMGLDEVMSPNRSAHVERNKAHAERAVAGGMSMDNFARK